VGLSVLEYVEKILKPGYTILKAMDAQANVLPCAFNNLPIAGNREDFWESAKGYYDIHNYHLYSEWGVLRKDADGCKEDHEMKDFYAEIEKHGEDNKPVWITEMGWWGTGSLTGTIYDTYRYDPNFYGAKDWTQGKIQSNYKGKEILTHPIVLREDALRAAWLGNVIPKILSLPMYEKIFLWVSIDEFEGGYDPESVYGRNDAERPAKEVDLWGIIAGDKAWRKSAYALREILKG
jgi:hypothetical protein